MTEERRGPWAAWRSAVQSRRGVSARRGVPARWTALPRWQRIAAGCCGAAGLLGAAVVGGPWLWVKAGSAGRIVQVEEVSGVPVALVLGAGIVGDQPTPFLAGRLDIARQLYAEGRVSAILVSGDNRTATYDEPTVMKRYLVARGVPDAKVVADFAGLDTYDSCVRANRIFGVTRAVVISQGYHVPRAVAICSAIGVDAVGVGDETARDYAPEVWQSGATREVLANVKAAWDVTIRRTPILGPRESGIDDALG